MQLFMLLVLSKLKFLQVICFKNISEVCKYKFGENVLYVK
jgi:hypothetical protein